MSAAATIRALTIASQIMTMVERGAQLSRQLNDLVGRAQREGRDITDDELEGLAQEADQADARLSRLIREAKAGK